MDTKSSIIKSSIKIKTTLEKEQEKELKNKAEKIINDIKSKDRKLTKHERHSNILMSRYDWYFEKVGVLLFNIDTCKSNIEKIKEQENEIAIDAINIYPTNKDIIKKAFKLGRKVGRLDTDIQSIEEEMSEQKTKLIILRNKEKLVRRKLVSMDVLEPEQKVKNKKKKKKKIKIKKEYQIKFD